MACVSLKRPLDLDPLEALHSPNRHQSKRQRCTPMKGIDIDSDMSTTPPGSPSSSSCIESSSSLTPSEIADKLRDKLTPMRRNRRLMTDDITLLTSPRHSSTSLSFQPQQSDAMNVESISTGCKEQTAVEKPVFTLQQMTLVCERLCKERTDQVRAEFDHILQQKLSEQYDSFVKFIDRQIQIKFNQSQVAPSYLS